MESQLVINIKDLFEHINADINYKKCKELIMKLKGKTRVFYIGVTKYSDVRISEHHHDKNASVMYILCKLPSKYQATILEQKLISYFSRNGHLNNQGGGGEGIIEGENYLYLLM